jgi:hypothetical protein
VNFETDFPSLTYENARATAANADFYSSGYDFVVNRVVAARGPKVVLGDRPAVCRFCARTVPEVTFRREAHAIPELVGNRTLVSLYECDDCNSRFSGFEDDFGKLTLAERVAGQVLGKAGVPSAKAGRGRSRIDMGVSGFRIEEQQGDPIAEVDFKAKTLTITIAPQPYRPLGVFKALMKMALSLMDENDLQEVPEVLRWLLAPDLITYRVGDGSLYSCFRTFTPGPAPFAATRAVLLRRRGPEVQGPAFIFVLAFGNSSFQVVVPAPQRDRHLIGKTIELRQVPVFGFEDPAQVRGSTRSWIEDLSSPNPVKLPSSVVFHFDSIEG